MCLICESQAKDNVLKYCLLTPCAMTFFEKKHHHHSGQQQEAVWLIAKLCLLWWWRVTAPATVKFRTLENISSRFFFINSSRLVSWKQAATMVSFSYGRCRRRAIIITTTKTALWCHSLLCTSPALHSILYLHKVHALLPACLCCFSLLVPIDDVGRERQRPIFLGGSHAYYVQLMAWNGHEAPSRNQFVRTTIYLHS